MSRKMGNFDFGNFRRDNCDLNVGITAKETSDLAYAKQSHKLIRQAATVFDIPLLPTPRNPSDAPNANVWLRREAKTIRCRQGHVTARRHHPINFPKVGRNVSHVFDNVE